MIPIDAAAQPVAAHTITTHEPNIALQVAVAIEPENPELSRLIRAALASRASRARREPIR